MNKVTAKSVLTKSKLPESDYCYNPYIGCTHNCKYCYAHFMKRFTGHDKDVWGQFLDYKENTIELLSKEIKKADVKNSILMSSVTDCYQPIEKKLELTRKSLEIFRDNNSKLAILTKSDIVVRDIDILKDMKNLELGLSIGIFNDDLAKILEPGATVPSKRIEALKKLHDAGINTYAFIGPIIPGISDIEKTILAVKDNVNYLMAEAINISGADKKIFIPDIEKILGKEKAKICLENISNNDYWNKVEEKYIELCKKYSIKNRGFFRHESKSIKK